MDEGRRNSILEETEREAREWWPKLSAFGDIKRGKSIAPPALALQRLLFDRLKAPPQFNREGQLTAGRDALVRIIEHQKSSDEAAECARVALELRRLEEDRKVLCKPLGADGRMHTGFGVAATVTGRWSSSRDPFGSGANLHALSRRVRSIFIPDKGKIFVSFDLAQAESKTVAYLARSQWYKDAHAGGNVHELVGKRIWPDAFKDGKDAAKATPLPWDADRNYYDLAKRTQHGFNYKLTAFGFARQAKMPVAAAREIRAEYFRAIPEVEEWHRGVADTLRRTHRLVTPMGRERLFLGRVWDEETIKEGVAHVPQSTVSDINKVILWRLWRTYDPGALQALLEIHDSVLFQVRSGDLDTIRAAHALTAVEVPIHGDVMIIPAEAEWGESWGHLEKIKL